MKNKTRLYNVIFPVWVMFIFPSILLIIIPANFIIDSIVLLISLKCLKLNIKENYKKSIVKVWIFGFIADIIGSLILFTTQFFPQQLYSITKAVAWNPYSNIYGFMIVFFAMLIAGYFIYLFNYKISFKKLNIMKKNKIILSIVLAITTMPYMFLIPTSYIYY